MASKKQLSAKKEMAPARLSTFEEALESALDPNHVLLGNGFSIACRPNIFRYDRLLDQADLSARPQARVAFDRLATTDFEIVMHALSRAAVLAEVYATSDPTLANRFRADAEALKEVLVQAIAGSHPDRPTAITDDECAEAKTFLSHFARKYSINYDLLTYWALMRSDVEPDISCNDGFRQPEEGPEEWVIWDPSQHGQNVFYLHGGLHIYQSGPEIRKFTWCNTGIALMDQIRAALDENKFPLYVAEGTWQEKMTRIQGSSFLGRAYRSFREIGGSLFTFGLSFNENDAHIADAIAHNKVERLFVSLYGDSQDPANRLLRERAEAIVTRRQQVGGRRPKPLEIRFYDAGSAHVWGGAMTP